VLVVDDDPKTVLVIRAYLEREGYHVLRAADGMSALRAIREEAPDLVVLDLMLPELDGMAVTRLARLESSVPIFMLNLGLRVMHVQFQAFLPPPGGILAVAEQNGLRTRLNYRGLVWQVAALARTA
jgi:CheY-like chemotaxis protein